jgi:hypothetical protein
MSIHHYGIQRMKLMTLEVLLVEAEGAEAEFL